MCSHHHPKERRTYTERHKKIPLLSKNHKTSSKLHLSTSSKVSTSALTVKTPPNSKMSPSINQKTTAKHSTSTKDKKRAPKNTTLFTLTNTTTTTNTATATTQTGIPTLMQLNISVLPSFRILSTSVTIFLLSSISSSPIFPWRL